MNRCPVSGQAPCRTVNFATENNEYQRNNLSLSFFSDGENKSKVECQGRLQSSDLVGLSGLRSSHVISRPLGF